VYFYFLFREQQLQIVGHRHELGTTTTTTTTSDFITPPHSCHAPYQLQPPHQNRLRRCRMTTATTMTATEAEEEEIETQISLCSPILAKRELPLGTVG
jgi:hypothetical protein